MRLAGKCAVVTGAGRGLGRASAIAMAREGAAVLLVSKTKSELEETAGVIRADGGKTTVFAADVAQPDELARLVAAALKKYGSVDIVMNNAAVIGPLTLLANVETDAWETAMAVNLRAPFLLAKEAIPHMMRRNGGKIINVTSGLGDIVMSPFGVYSITKAGLIHMTRILAEELKPWNIQVNGLDPAVMDTRMQEEIRSFGPAILGEDVFETFVALKEKGELLSPERVAKLAVFLASAEADAITGENGTERDYRKLGFFAE